MCKFASGRCEDGHGEPTQGAAERLFCSGWVGVALWTQSWWQLTDARDWACRDRFERVLQITDSEMIGLRSHGVKRQCRSVFFFYGILRGREQRALLIGIAGPRFRIGRVLVWLQ